MDKNTINEKKKTDIGTGVQMSNYFNHKSPTLQGNYQILRISQIRIGLSPIIGTLPGSTSTMRRYQRRACVASAAVCSRADLVASTRLNLLAHQNMAEISRRNKYRQINQVIGHYR